MVAIESAKSLDCLGKTEACTSRSGAASTQSAGEPNMVDALQKGFLVLGVALI